MRAYVPERFTRKVVAHAIAASSLERYPLILAIQGRPGDGKSYQAATALRESNFTVLTMSSVLLAGNLEGEPIRQFKELYGRGKGLVEHRPDTCPVLILEDFDLGPAGSRADTKYTVNSQLLNGFLMSLADDVEMCDLGTSQRFPIIMTGNDFTVLHGPLIRPGRVDFFSWEPTEDERVRMILSAVGEYLPDLESTRTRYLVKKFSKLPVSAFVAAVNECVSVQMYDLALRSGRIDMVRLKQRYGNGVTTNVAVAEFEEALHRQQDAARRPARFY